MNQIIESAAHIGMFLVPMLFSLCVHEYAHGWVALKKGDQTAYLMGRLTLNPAAHLDWIGTVVMPIIAAVTRLPVFGWAKPVPVDPRNLKNPKQDMFWIALAGPASNLIQAVLGALLLGIFFRFSGESLAVAQIINNYIIVNLFLAFFNLIPLHPLDGGKILARFLPDSVNRRLEEMQGMMGMILVVLVVTGGFQYLAIPVQLTGQLLIEHVVAIML